MLVAHKRQDIEFGVILQTADRVRLLGYFCHPLCKPLVFSNEKMLSEWVALYS